MMKNNALVWMLWIFLSLVITAYFGFTLLVAEDKSELLIGETSYGHYQIEMACSSCHTEAFGGEEVIQNACVNCHGEAMEFSQDSHPRKKFTDPRDAYLLETIDARYCVSCHTEHQEEQTHAMGLTLPDDYCFHCHKDIGDDRPSHKDLGFDSCSSSGCHNYHDNRGLYENFLVKHANQPWLKQPPFITSIITPPDPLAVAEYQSGYDDREKISEHPDIHQQWSGTKHAQADIGCGDCHINKSDNSWQEKPPWQHCQGCHKTESEGFVQGKHGMRLSPKVDLTMEAITPAHSPLHFNEAAQHAQQGCNSCHSAHDYNTEVAAVDACLQCHNDSHSANFMTSPHGNNWQQAKNGGLSPDSAVSCATCHMPRMAHSSDGMKFVTELREDEIHGNVIRVEHNQNFNLRPNEKMIRSVCMRCHSVDFSINALADKQLIESNFNGTPSTQIKSMEWALKRENKAKD